MNYERISHKAMNKTQIIGISGSLRKSSANTGLLRAAQRCAQKIAGLEIQIADISTIPFFNADISLADIPTTVSEFINKLNGADAFMFACPEYNYSIAPALKNALDWASRAPENAALSGKPVAILGAGGIMGSSRAQYHLRQVCVFLNLYPVNKPEIFANAFTDFDANGDLTQVKTEQLIEAQLRALALMAQGNGSPSVLQN